MNELIIHNTSQVVTPKPGVIRGAGLKELEITNNGAVYIKNGVIQAVSSINKLLKNVEGDPVIIDAEGKAVIPGFVDSHSHLVFGGSRTDEFALRTKGLSYEEIASRGGGIVSTVEATRNASKKELENTAWNRLQKALRQGITTMEIKSGYGLNLETERTILEVIDKLKSGQPIELTTTFLGAHAVPNDVEKSQYINRVLEMIPELSGLSDFCDVFCEDGYFSAEESKKILEKGLEFGLKPKVHTNQFNDIGGVELALDLGAVSVDHLEVLSDEDIERISGSDTVATVLPGVSWFLNIPYAPARKLLDSGAIVALATDFNPGSSMTLSMQLMMNMACIKMSMTINEALCCATQNGAVALGKEKLGCIAPGYQADLLLLNTDNYKDLAYFFGENHVQTVIKKGIVVCQSEI